MRVGEARSTYSTQLKAYHQQLAQLSKQRSELADKMNKNPDDKTAYADEAAVLELQYNAVSEKQQEYQDYMNQLTEQWANSMNMEATKQQGEAMSEYAKDVGKIMEVARRMMHGDLVPSSDEKKLMEYDDKMYQMAKNAQMMAQIEKRKKHKSLWEDEEPKEQVDPMEKADNEEAFAEGPAIESVSDVMASAAADFSSETATE